MITQHSGATMADRTHCFLVVDDEPDILFSLKALFRREYKVLTAGSAHEALERLARDEVHVLMTDQRMPEMNGTQLLEAVRDRYPDVVRLMFTGYADIKAVVESINVGHVYRYITKPWDPDELRSIIAAACERYDLLEERRILIEELRKKNRELEGAYAELTELDHLRTVFMETASHELKTPLSGLLAYVQLLTSGRLDAAPERKRLALEGVSRTAGRLRKVVTNVLKFTEADRAAPAPVDRRPVDVKRLVHDVVEDLQVYLELRQQTIEVHVEDGLFAEGEVDLTRDALANLLQNAIKFSEDGKVIRVRGVHEEQGRVAISVEDQGIGIPERDLPRIWNPIFPSFDMMHHSSGVYEFNTRGMGMGLAIARRFIGLQGGETDVRSSVGEGSCFTLRLPSSDQGV